MNITRGLPSKPFAGHPVLTIGNFDGQHLGHQALVRAVVDCAAQIGGLPVVMTFDPHPIEVLRPELPHKYLSDQQSKQDFFERHGIAELLIMPFTPELAALLPAQFVQEVLCDGLGTRKILVGEHFVFGKGRSGSVYDLQKLGLQANFTVDPIPPVLVGERIVSSTRIRKCLGSGNVREAAQCLGRFYGLSGTVIHGDHRGAQLGWPTANIRLPAHRVLPADGVYATMTVVDGEQKSSIAYIGRRPTFQEGERLLEVHIFDQDLSLYGKTLMVNFIDFIRGDQDFGEVDALIGQMKRDGEYARSILARINIDADRSKPHPCKAVE